MNDALNFFQWTTRDGQVTESHHPPTRNLTVNFEEINELCLLRPDAYFSAEKERLKTAKGTIGLGEFAVFKNQPVPIHKEFTANGELPPNLTIFRANGCKLWNWPQFPATIIEIEMMNCCLLTIPDLSFLGACTILMLNDGIIADCIGPLPPRLEVLGLATCAINKWTVGTVIPDSLGQIFMEGNPSAALRAIPDEIRMRFNFRERRWRPRPQVQFQDGRRFIENANGGGDGRIGAVNGGGDGRIAAVNIAANSQNVHESGFQESTRKNIELLIKYRLQRLRPMSKETHSGKVRRERIGILGTLVSIFTNGDGTWEKYLAWLTDVTKQHDGTTAISQLGVAKYFEEHSTAEEVFLFLKDSYVGGILQSYMSTPYSVFGTNFIEIAIRTCEKILDMSSDGEEGEKRKELLKRLQEEVIDGNGKCTNGMIVRLTNVFIGFDDAFIMNAAPSTVLGGRIPLLLEKLRKEGGWAEGEEPSDYWRKVIEQILTDMEEMNLEQTKWNNWISDFIESYKESLEKEGKLMEGKGVLLSEKGLKALGICKPFFEDQIRMWAGLVDFEGGGLLAQ